MKIVLRNLISTIRNFKAAWIMNFAGITAALTALMFVGMQIFYERSFDTYHQNSDRIFVIKQGTEQPWDLILQRKDIEVIGNISPKIEAYSAKLDFVDKYYVETEGNNGGKHGFQELVVGIDSGYVKMFDFDLICGDPKSLNEKGHLLISESIAMRMFGTTDVLGKSITIDGIWCGEPTNQITGVYKDFPANTQTQNAIYYSLDETAKHENYGRNFLGWAMLSSPDDREYVEQLINQSVESIKTFGPFRLEPIHDSYYANENNAGFLKSGSSRTTTMLSIIALIVLLISAINQTNFNIALIPMRIKSINTQKVLGGDVSLLSMQLFAENIIICLISWLTALLMVTILKNTWLTSFIVSDDLSVSGNFGVCLLVGLIALIINAISNIYPIYKLTSANPAMVLKGSYGRSQSGRKLRNGLMVFQYLAAICFISIAVSIWMQLKYMENSNYILKDNQIAIFHINENFGKKFDLVDEKLKNNSAIENVACSQTIFGGSDSYNTMRYLKDGDTLHYYSIYCTREMLDVFGIPLTAGDGFQNRPNSEIVPQNYKNDCIITDNLGKGIEYLGDSLLGAVKGLVASNIKITSYRANDLPIAFVLDRADDLSYCYVKIAKGSNVKDAIKQITTVVGEIAPELPLEIEFYDTVFQRLYQKEIKTSATTIFMAILAILISIIGVFGMVTFDTEYKRQEISIRKVFGADNSNIFKSVNLKYIKMVGIGFALSLPVTYYVISNWQQSFVEKISLPWWLYILILIGITLLTIAIVTVQSAKTIFQNPVEGMRKE
ncbi:MAG: ABC transporter permease [Bacteroidales bacterium]|nr:ABC transporter permease [Bacteroidales bacterium]